MVQQIAQVRPIAIPNKVVLPSTPIQTQPKTKLAADNISIGSKNNGIIPANKISFSTGNLDKVVDHVLGPNKVQTKVENKPQTGLKGLLSKLLG